MVDISERVREIRKLVDDGKYFTINRARQYGKTTTLRALQQVLREDVVLGLSFEGISRAGYQREETAPLHYNKEDSLRSVIKLAYYTYRDHYLQWEELPGGEGYADIVYLPKKESDWPALVIELKWNESAEGAIAQIMNRKYPESLKDFGGEIVLVGVSYSRQALTGYRKHTCRIVRV